MVRSLSRTGYYQGRQTLSQFMAAFPWLTIADVRSGLPWNEAFLDRNSEGFESAGMRL
jgi:hypothetical protein